MGFHSPPTEEQQTKFLELIASGKTRQEAAVEVGGSATQFRTFQNGKGEASLAFAERYIAVLEEIGSAPSPHSRRIRELEGVQLVHRLLDEFITRALDRDGKQSPSSNRLLYQLSLLKVEDFKPLLEARTRVVHEGQVGIYAMPQIDTSQWSIEEHEEFVRLDKRRSELIAKAQPAGTPQPALPAPDDDDDVVDAEVEEIEAA